MTTVEPPPADPIAPRSRRLGPFRHRPFAIYWGGGFLSNLGSWLQTVAGSIFVYQLTGSALAVGLLNFAGFLPIFLFSIAGGVVSDRFDRRRVVIAGHVASVVLAGALAAVTIAGVATEAHLIGAFFAINTLYALSKPSIIALLPSLVPRDEVTDAVGLNTLQFILGQITGPLLAAGVMATGGASWAFTINALTYLGPIASMVYLQRRGIGSRVDALVAAGESRARAVSGGSYIRQHPWVIALLFGIVAVSAPLELVRTLSPAIVVEGLGEPESAAGVIVAAQAIGSALAVIAFVPLRRRGWSRRIASLGLLFQAAGLIGTALAPSLPIAVLTVGLIGCGFSLGFPVLTGALQVEVPDHVRGRVMAFHQTAHLGNRPITALVAGFLAGVVGAHLVPIFGALLAPIGLVAARRAWRTLDAERSSAEGEVHEPERRPPGEEAATLPLR